MINITKADGTLEKFSEEKLISSIRRAGIPRSFENELLEHVRTRLYEGIPSSKIYKQIQEYLIKTKEPYQAMYSLKRAIMEIGPTGFPFEVYVSEILKSMGYKTTVGTILRGQCVNHEVDIIAQNQNEKIFVECKYHNKPGIRSDVHVALYTKARFEDLKAKHNFSGAMLVTNTKVTSDALDFANCSNIKVIGWDYPKGEGLRDLVERYKLFPITQFSFMSGSEKAKLLGGNIVLAKQICENPDILNQVELGSFKKRQIIDESMAMCNL